MIRLGGHTIPADGRTRILGIVNNTPDSFYDGGRHFGVERAIEHGRALILAGADLLDVGGQTGQIGREIAVREEVERVVPVIAGLGEACVSVDTYRAAVAAEALAC